MTEGAKSSRGVLLVVCAAVFFSVLNASIVNVVLPVIGRDLSVEPTGLGWVITSYLLVYAVAIPFYGRLADLYGARKLFLFGLSVFSAGSLLCAVAPSYPLLLLARLVQASGGAAVPGLGITLTSRAYPPARRGSVLGWISTTIGIAAAIGPTLGGAVSDALGWNYVFVIGALAGLLIPPALSTLPMSQNKGEARLDVPGGLFLGLTVSGALLAVTEGARSGWAAPQVVGAAAVSGAALIALVVRQSTARSPFVPRELVGSPRYVALVGMSFTATAANLAPLVGLPLLLTSVNNLTPSQVGLALLPAATTTAVLGAVAGRVKDQIGGRIPVRGGLAVMLVALLCLSSYAGNSVWMVSALMALLGAGFAFVNTPLSAVVSLVVPGQVLASAMSINSMLFFLGGSFGTALVTAMVVARAGDGTGAVNPFHVGPGANFSDAFLLLSVPLLIAAALSTALPGEEQTHRPQTSPGSATVDPRDRARGGVRR